MPSMTLLATLAQVCRHQPSHDPARHTVDYLQGVTQFPAESLFVDPTSQLYAELGLNKDVSAQWPLFLALHGPHV